jgi:hypothetical protein
MPRKESIPVERQVEINVSRLLRDRIREAKGLETYDEFFRRVLKQVGVLK